MFSSISHSTAVQGGDGAWLSGECHVINIPYACAVWKNWNINLPDVDSEDRHKVWASTHTPGPCLFYAQSFMWKDRVDIKNSHNPGKSKVLEGKCIYKRYNSLVAQGKLELTICGNVFDGLVLCRSLSAGQTLASCLLNLWSRCVRLQDYSFSAF